MNLGPLVLVTSQHRMSGSTKIQNPTMCCLEGLYLDSKNAKEKGWKKTKL